MSAPALLWGQEWSDADDVTLLGMVRGGDAEAYAELWRRHLPAAYAVAHRHRGRTSAEDVVAEASLRVYDLIRAGKGPLTNFRSYFLSAVRTIAVDYARGELRVVPTEDTVRPEPALWYGAPRINDAPEGARPAECAMQLLTTSLISVGLLAITLNRPFEIGWHGMSIMVMLIGTYVFIPNRFMPATLVAVITSVAFLWLVLLHFRPGPNVVVTLITLLVVLNILGAMAAYRISRMQHEAYLDAAVLRQANDSLQLEMHRRQALEEDLRELLERDPLTGLPNRAHFFPRAQELLDAADLDSAPLGFVMADIDYFRQINGTYGHSRADEVLQCLAGCCRNVAPGTALYGRLGGDDFAIVLPGADAAATATLAERLRQEVRRTSVDLGDTAMHFTVSIGIAQRVPGENINSLLRRGDLALSAAKYNGRDRVEASGELRRAGGRAAA